MNRLKRFSVALVVAAALTGCATSSNPRDPLERFNRTMFSFNEVVDESVLKPTATAYSSTIPPFVQAGIGNFFGNLADVWTAINNLLQGKGAEGISDVMRVAVNSTLGLGGLLDIGSEAGMSKHKEDFGQTLAVWGVRSGPYLVLPLLGSSTVRDAAVLPVDWAADPWIYKNPVRWRMVGSVVRVVDQRAAVLGASNLIEAAALDKYEFVRDAYLQRRANSVDSGYGPAKKTPDRLKPNPAPPGKQAPHTAPEESEPKPQTGIEGPVSDWYDVGEGEETVSLQPPTQYTVPTTDPRASAGMGSSETNIPPLTKSTP